MKRVKIDRNLGTDDQFIGQKMNSSCEGTLRCFNVVSDLKHGLKLLESLSKFHISHVHCRIRITFQRKITHGDKQCPEVLVFWCTLHASFLRTGQE